MHVGDESGDFVLCVEISGEGQGALSHAVVATAKGDDGRTARGSLAQLEGGIHRIGPRGTTELNLGVVPQFGRQGCQKGVDKFILHRRSKIQGMQRGIFRNQVYHGLVDFRVIVTKNQGPCTTEAVEVLVPLHILHPNSLSLLQRKGEFTGVTSRIGLSCFLARHIKLVGSL